MFRYKKAVSTTRSRVDVQLAVSPTYRRRPPQQVRSIAFSSGNDSSVAPPQKQQKLTLSALDPSHGGRPRASHAQRPQNNSSKTTPAEGQQAETPFDLSKVQVSADGKVRPEPDCRLVDGSTMRLIRRVVLMHRWTLRWCTSCGTV